MLKVTIKKNTINWWYADFIGKTYCVRSARLEDTNNNGIPYFNYYIVNKGKYKGNFILKTDCSEKDKYQKAVIKEADNFYAFDYYYIISLLYETIKQTRNYMKDNGMEVEKDGSPMITRMDKILSLLKKIKDNDFDSLIEKKWKEKIVHSISKEPTKRKNEKFCIVHNNISKRQKSMNDKIYRAAERLKRKTYKKAFKLIGKQIEEWWD